MSDRSIPTPFGRRRAPPQPRRPDLARAEDLGEAAEAFRRGLKAESGQTDAFAAWRRGRRAAGVALWAVSLALMSPGALCALVHAPWWTSAGLELAGLFAGGWIRSERRRRLGEIADWSEDRP